MIEVRQTASFAAWLDALRDDQAKTKIIVRIRRIELGNFGDVKPVGAGVSEVRITHGPGYRLYFVQQGKTVIVLLCGGEKSSQRRYIAAAKQMAKEL